MRAIDIWGCTMAALVCTAILGCLASEAYKRIKTSKSVDPRVHIPTAQLHKRVQAFQAWSAGSHLAVGCVFTLILIISSFF